VKVIIVFLFSFFSFSVNAAEFSGTITSIASGPNLGSVVLIRVDGQSVSAPWSVACSSQGFWSFKFDTSAAGGKETYSLLLAAYASKTSVTIAGTGICSPGAIGNVQDLGYARFN